MRSVGNTKLSRPRIVAACAAVGTLVIWGAWHFGGKPALAPREGGPAGSAPQAAAGRQTGEREPRAAHQVDDRPDAVAVGPSEPGVDSAESDRSRSETKLDELRAAVGKTPDLAPDINPHVKSVAEALVTKQHPQRVSVAVVPPAFDKTAYEADPQLYLNEVVPARVFQAAQPSPKVTQLFPVGEVRHQVKQNESAALRVQAVPGAPVTFTSFDLGEFDNRLPSITVKADEAGVAQAKFTGSPGTFNDVNILAASPLTSGQVRFSVFVAVSAPQVAK